MRTYLKLYLTAVTLGALCAPRIGVAQEPSSSPCGYSGRDNPTRWGELDRAYSTCSLGRTQSPINIVGAQPADLPQLKVDYESAPLNIIDNGHTVQVTYPLGSTLKVGDKVYTLLQFHFHTPSEEHVEGRSFPLVAHLVHSDAEGHLAVLAILFTAGPANPLIDALWRNIPAEKGKAQEIRSVSIDAADLLPAGRGYITYEGSLTTPPCSEGVSWYVLKTHPTISPAQLAEFRKLYPGNARLIQPTNGREILQTK